MKTVTIDLVLWSPTSQANGLLDVFPGGGTKGGEADFMAFLYPYV